MLDTAGERSRYSQAFDAAYKEDYSSAEAVVDLHRLDASPVRTTSRWRCTRPPATQAGNRRLKIYVTGATITLSRALPLLQSLGAVVIDENPYQVTRSDGTPSRIYDFGLQLPAAYLPSVDGGSDEAQAAARTRVTDAFTAAWNGRAEVDGLNELVLAAGLDWRQVSVFRAYAKYLRQIGTPYTQGYLESVLVAHAAIAAQLAELFAVRFDPARHAGDDAARGPRKRPTGRRDRRPAGRGHQPGRRPDPAHLPAAHPGHRAHQRLPPGRRRRAPRVLVLQTGPAPDLVAAETRSRA